MTRRMPLTRLMPLMRHLGLLLALVALGALVVLLLWAWRQGGLELLQLDMVVC